MASFGRLLRSYRKDAPTPDEQLSLATGKDGRLDASDPTQTGSRRMATEMSDEELKAPPAELVRGDSSERRVSLGPDGRICSIQLPVAEIERLGQSVATAMLTVGADLYFKGLLRPEAEHFRVVAVTDQEEGWKQVDVEPIPDA